MKHLSVLLLFIAAGFNFVNEIQAQSRVGYPRVMQGPMVGAVDADEARIWARVSGEFPCQVRYATNPDFTDATTSEVEQAVEGNDYCVTLQVKDLEPGTTYYYRVLVNGSADSYIGDMPPFTFKTAPAGPARFKIAFGSCSRVQEDPYQRIWETVNLVKPDLFFWLGDNIYGDSLEPRILGDEYQRQREVPRVWPMMRNTPQLAVWDDHDYGLNNHDRTNPIKIEVLDVFQNYWANPGYGLPDAPGCFFKYSYGGVDFFFLDVRYYRDPNEMPDSAEKTMLGEAQLKWLKDELSASYAPFKVLVSGSGFTKAKGEGGDSWASYMTERNDLLEYIQEEEISGVVLMSGDTHIGELNAIPRSEQGGYDLYELVSSPLAQTPGGFPLSRFPERRIRQGYVSSENVGVIEIDMTLDDPVLRFNLYDVKHEPVWDWFEVKASELKNGVSTWREKMDLASLERYERQQAGEGYYLED